MLGVDTILKSDFHVETVWWKNCDFLLIKEVFFCSYTEKSLIVAEYSRMMFQSFPNYRRRYLRDFPPKK